MDSLLSPKFKSRVEQFYYDHMTGSQQDLESQQDYVRGEENLKTSKRSHSGDGRKSYFTFDSADIKFHDNARKTLNDFIKSNRELGLIIIEY